jgi:hypothetical protein
MLRITSYTGDEVVWVQPSASRQNFELYAGENLLAQLDFRSAWGTLATAKTADGTWTFKRQGFLNPRITVREENSEEDLGIYIPRFWGGGRLVMKSGQEVVWRSLNFWNTAWAFQTTQEEPLLIFRYGIEGERLRDMFKNQATVELHNSQLTWLYPLLAPLGMYLLVLHQADSGAAVAATAGAA